MDVVELSDQELRQKLLDLGYQPGPIIESTRRVYELKYLKMLGELGSSDSDRECDVTVPSPTSPVKLPTGSPGHTPRPRPVSRAPIKPTTQVSEAKILNFEFLNFFNSLIVRLDIRKLKLEVKFENEKVIGCVRFFLDKSCLKSLLLLKIIFRSSAVLESVARHARVCTGGTYVGKNR